ncbi:MAG: hypothetical protein WBN19_06845 [Lutimonas sp.]
MKNWFFLIFIILQIGFLQAQTVNDSLVNTKRLINADDPSQFITRVEVFNEFQHYAEGDYNINQTVLRGVVTFGKRFTTRLDIPLVYNSLTNTNNQQQTGLGDISFRLLGYKVLEKPKSALTTSIEISLNTAESPYLGKGKNLLIPMITYSRVIPKEKMLLAMTFQQAITLGGDETRDDLSFSKLQFIILKRWSQKAWAVLQPECYIDYIHGGVSMNLRSRMVYVPKPRINIYLTPSVGLFGDFIARYQWSADIGVRYFLFRK